jgi:hypothetical protein
MLGCSRFTTKEAPVSEYDGKQFVGIDLHRNRSVIVRQTVEGEQLGVVRIVNDPVALGVEIGKAGECPEVVLDRSSFAVGYRQERSHPECSPR